MQLNSDRIRYLDEFVPNAELFFYMSTKCLHAVAFGRMMTAREIRNLRFLREVYGLF
jgi:hypothetical protein